jgi:hypothetical protein
MCRLASRGGSGRAYLWADRLTVDVFIMVMVVYTDGSGNATGVGALVVGISWAGFTDTGDETYDWPEFSNSELDVPRVHSVVIS